MAIAVKTVNGFPYWCQVDYGGSISSAGCAPTAAAMVLKALGKDTDPEKLCSQCKGHGWNPSGGASKETLFPYIGKLYNVSVEFIYSFSKCVELAKQGYPIILDGRKDPGTSWRERCLRTCYGPAGHYVVLVAMSGNDVVINDPRGVFASGIRPRSHASDGFICGIKLGNTKFNLDSSSFKKLGSTDGVESGGGTPDGTLGDSDSNLSYGGSFSSGGGNYSGNSIHVIYNDTTTVQESLPNANVSDNWVDMHEIKGITLHMYPPYHNCTADSMAKYFESLGWDRNFHYKVDKDTKIDFSKKPVSGQTTGGNVVGSSVSDYEITPKDPLNQGVIINGEDITISDIGGGSGSIGSGSGSSSGGIGDGGSASPGEEVKGDDVASKIYNYCVAQGCSAAAACGIVGNAEMESSLKPNCVNGIGAIGLFQWLGDRKAKLKQKASAAGKDWSNADIQIQFMWQEWSGDSYLAHLLRKKYNMTLSGWKKISDPRQAAKIFAAVFERGEDGADSTGKRGNFAQKWYDKFSKQSRTVETNGRIATTFAAHNFDIMTMDGDIESSEPFGWPVPGQDYIQSYFGYRTDSLGYHYHPGIDIVNYAGYGAYCYANGTVKKVLTDTRLGGYVRVDHENGIQTVYGSLDEIFVKENDKVYGGQCIATTGNTVANPLMHLHFGMMVDGEYVDPLDYVEPGGGVKETAPTPYSVMPLASISDTSKNITWDNVDKGKICFASADNNTHTYIDANLFNNQHPKYTLSVGLFFYDESDLVEKTGNINYPKTERKLIEQCAKALYDEGFTSEQLWREFDLNRAPSPFLYLDREKWVELCEQIDNQVEWLNTKYGKVTATYKPNELLENQNKNEFIETAPLPDGVSGIIVPGGNGSSGNNNSNSGIDDSGGTTPGTGNFIWPVPGITRISSKFGPRKAPVAGASTYHKGIDIPASKGTAVVASDSGKVVVAKTGYNGGRGNYIVIDHGNGMGSLYQHLNKYVVRVGQSVKQGDKVAEVGNTGIGTGPHLHFEVHSKFSGIKGTPVNPENYVSPRKRASLFARTLAAASYTAEYTSDIETYSEDYIDDDNDMFYIQRPGLFIGDDWEDGIRDYVEGSGEYYSLCEAEKSKDASYYYDPSRNIDRLDGMEKKVSFVYIHLGYNRLKDDLETNNTTRFLNRVRELYTNVPIYIAKLPHSGRRYSGEDYTNADAFNKAIDEYNENLKQYCIKNNLFFIDTSSGLMDSEGYLKETLVNSDGITLNDYTKYYNNIKDIIEPTAGISMAEIDEEAYYTVYSINEQQTRTISTFAAINNKVYCFVGNTSGTKMYEEAKTTSKVLANLAVGDELQILDKDSPFYKCKFGSKTGYVSMKDVAELRYPHGEVSKNNIGKPCWIRYENTDFYKDANLKTKNKDLKEQTKVTVVDAIEDVGIYKIKANNTTGYVKGYAVTFIEDFFKQTNNTETKASNLDKVKLSNANFESNNLSMWIKEGKIDLSYRDNPGWQSNQSWPYRGEGFVRITNDTSEMAGIKQNFEIMDDEDNCDLKIKFYAKQVTQTDVEDGPTNPNTLKRNNIFIKILDGNNRVKYEKEIDTSKLSNTSWSALECTIKDVEALSYSIFIGNNKKFDLFIDDISIEKIYKEPIKDTDTDTDTEDSSGNGSEDGETSTGEVISGIDQSGLGVTSIDNGGIMEYTVGNPTDPNAEQPEIETVITQEEYEEIMKYSAASDIDIYTNSFEPYDKDLNITKTVGLTNDSRLTTLTETIDTFTENMIRYKVVETGPGSVDHCVKPVDELSVLYKNTMCKVDPIYPDLVIPPKYTTSNYDTISRNSIPLTTVEDATVSIEDTLDKSFSYEYNLLNRKTKVSKGKPVNYYDPYPYDDKITDLENHYPKVLIDEIESRLYSCNHPGCPIAHPMAKNFAMLNDMAINQSKLTEQRLVRIENVLSTMTRYLGRMASRVNINCVYYGGQTVLGKYKCIRCLRDDRVHDGATVTMDQCLTCTRYEPIIGQIYDILDETGFNGSAILDDMQMSYMSLTDFKNLNDVEKRSTTYDYINTNKEETKKPKSLIDEWQEKDKIVKERKTGMKQEEMKPSDYLFMMDWTEESVDLQRPDVKSYPTEKIAAKYYNQSGDPGEVSVASAEKSTQMGTDDTIYETIASGEWVDTREVDDSMQINTYTSLDFYFENFNLNRTGYEYDNGIKGNIGIATGNGGSGGYGSNSGDISDSINGDGAKIRSSITEMALTIVQEHKDKKACYSRSPRTIDHDKPQRLSGTHFGMLNPIGYDCTGFVSCCYKAAGINYFYGGQTGQGSVSGNTLVQDILKKGGSMWYADSEGVSKARPGDVLMCYRNAKLDKNKIADGSGCKATHAMIYMGDKKVAHSSTDLNPWPNQILYEDASYYLTGKMAGHCFFLRPKALEDADNKAASSGASGVNEVAGTIDGMNYVCKFSKARCTEYGPWGDGQGTGNTASKVSSGKSWTSVVNRSVAAHNMPFGTKIYIPALKGVYNSDGIFSVEDNGGYTFDFDIATSRPHNKTGFYDVYVISFGSGIVTKSFTAMKKVCDKYYGPNAFNKAFNDYMKYGGCTIKFSKFNSEDAKATWWKK